MVEQETEDDLSNIDSNLDIAHETACELTNRVHELRHNQEGSYGKHMVETKCKKFGKAKAIVETCEKLVKTLKAVRDELNGQLSGQFLEEGTQSINVEGSNYHLKRAIFVNKRAGFSQHDACEALIRADLSDFVERTYQSASVKAYVKELLDAMPPGTLVEDAIPESLRHIFAGYEQSKIAVLKTK